MRGYDRAAGGGKEAQMHTMKTVDEGGDQNNLRSEPAWLRCAGLALSALAAAAMIAATALYIQAAGGML